MRHISVDSLGHRLWPPRCVLCGLPHRGDRAVENRSGLSPAALGPGAQPVDGSKQWRDQCPDQSPDQRSGQRSDQCSDRWPEWRAGVQDICGACLQDLSWLTASCVSCGMPLPETPLRGSPEWLTCAVCINDPLFTECCVACDYSYPMNLLVQALKFRRRRSMGRVLGYILGNAVAKRAALFSRRFAETAGLYELPGVAAMPEHDSGIATRALFARSEPVSSAVRLQATGNSRPLPDTIIPVPLHARRLFTRGYNQAAEIAYCLPQPFRRRVSTNLCRRVRHTAMQSGLLRDERAANLAGAFALTRRGHKQVAGQRIAVLDDVITTGATAQAMSHMLYSAGASYVEVWAVARTV